MKRACIILVSLLFLTACTKTKEAAPPVTTIATTSTAATTVTTSTTTTIATTEQLETTSTIITSKTKDATTKKSTTSTSPKNAPACTHLSYCEATQCPNRFEKGHIHIFGALGYDAKSGIENALDCYFTCTEPGERLYKCSVCSEVVFVKYLEIKGHDFTGEEKLERYPTVKEEGIYIKKCNHPTCSETLITRTIPKREGDYSTIDPCFKVEYYKGECYTIEELDINVYDKRTYGKVPTIQFDYETYLLSIKYTNQQGVEVGTQIPIDKTFHDNWEWFSCSINEDGTVDSRYHRLSVNGTAS